MTETCVMMLPTVGWLTSYKRCFPVVVIMTMACAFVLYTSSVTRFVEYSSYRTSMQNKSYLSKEEVTTDVPTSERKTGFPSPTKDQPGVKLKKILFWNSWYNRIYYDFGAGNEPFWIHNCLEKRCTTTANRDEFDKADAVVVCGRLLDWRANPVLPPRRDPEQVFVYFNREAPVTQLGNNHRLKNIFNITMTYRRDSTIPFPYAVIVPRTNKTSYSPVTLEDIRSKSKTNPVSWMVSRCHKQGCVRHEYAKHLSRYIPVDVYGKCGNLTCPRSESNECMIMQERRYKFYLAFENALCRDYVTEKAFRTLSYNIVPVVMGGQEYGQILPPHSFIDVRDFQSPEDLARYLHYLNDNDTAYLEYFEWKRDYEVRVVDVHEPFCTLCQLLHQQSRFLVDFDLELWWDGMSGDTCILDDYRRRLMEYFNLDPDIPPMPRTHTKLLKKLQASGKS